ncbi:armadillo-type protein [Mycena sp. CBHHK59/15]|nr:armadillo-type protein [Mycena sp. CBHHK59/15]
MPRPNRPPSIRSWWSNSNRPGATIAIHPIAMMVAKLLHHRQVLNLIKRNGVHPFSASQLDQFIPYLQSNEIRTSTKTEILKQIDHTSQYDRGLQAVVDANLTRVLVDLLQSQDDGVLGLTCSVLDKILLNETLDHSVLDVDACSSLVLILRRSKSPLRVAAMQILRRISGLSESGAQAVVDANVLPTLNGFMQSTEEMKHAAWAILDNITSHEKLIQHVMAWYSDLSLADVPSAGLQVHRRVVHTLSHLSFPKTPADFDLNLLSALVDQLKCLDPQLIRCACQVLNAISTGHEPLVDAMVDLGVCAELVSLLGLPFDADTIHFPAVRALYRITVVSKNAAHAIVGAGGIPHLLSLLQSSNNGTIYLACHVLRNIASRRTLVPTLVEAISPLAALLQVFDSDRVLHGTESTTVLLAVISSLCQIAKSEVGASNLVALDALPTLVRFLRSSNVDILRWTCKTLGNIASHESLVFAVIKSDPWALTALLRQKNGVNPAVVYAFYQIAHSSVPRHVLGVNAIYALIQLLLLSPPPCLIWSCVVGLFALSSTRS